MWIAYALVAFALAALFGLLGLWPISLVLLGVALLAALVLLARGSSRRIGQASAPSDIPTSREASYEARVDPSQTPTGSSTGT